MRVTGFFNRESLAAVFVALLSLGIGVVAIGGIESYAAEDEDFEITVRIDVSPFDKIEIGDLMSVIYQQGEFPGYVELTTLPDFVDCLDVTEKDGTLILGCRPKAGGDNLKLTVRVVTPRLHKIKTSGVTSFEVDGVFRVEDSIDVSANDVSNVNFGEVVGNKMNLSTKGVAGIYILAAELNNLDATANETSSMRLKGLNVGNIEATAKSIASITLGGRCRHITNDAGDLAKVNRKGLIVEDSGFTDNHTPATAVPPREP